LVCLSPPRTPMMLVVLMLDVLRSDGGEDDEVFWLEPDSPEALSLPVWGCAR